MDIIYGTIREDAVVANVKGKDFVKFMLTTVSYVTRKGKKTKRYRTYRCSYWKTANIAPYLLKGTVLQLFGEEKIGAFLNSENKPTVSFDFHVDEIMFAQVNMEDREEKKPELQTDPVAEPANGEDDLPF